MASASAASACAAAAAIAAVVNSSGGKRMAAAQRFVPPRPIGVPSLMLRTKPSSNKIINNRHHHQHHQQQRTKKKENNNSNCYHYDSRGLAASAVVRVAPEDLEVIHVQSSHAVDQQEDSEAEHDEQAVNSSNNSNNYFSSSQVDGFAFGSGIGGGDMATVGSGAAAGGGDMATVGSGAAAGSGVFSSSSSSSSSEGLEQKGEGATEGGDFGNTILDRAINAAIVLAAGSFVITKLLTIDRDYWHGWTLYEILRYAPQHNWIAYEEALKTNPVLAKMMISGVVYSVGDWIAQCYEGKPLFDFDRARMFRSGLVGFTLHGSLSHYYYYFCEALFPYQDWWVVPAKVLFDQTVWAAIWNSIYYVILGFLRFESPVNVFKELRATFWPMLTAGWKLWPFAHLITYGVIPIEQRLLWVDCVELVWVTILSTYSNEKSEARHLEEAPESGTRNLEE